MYQHVVRMISSLPLAADEGGGRAYDYDDDDAMLVGPPPPEMVEEMDALPEDARDAEVGCLVGYSG